MPESLWAVVRDGRIELLQPANLPDGVHLRLTVVTDTGKDPQFWLGASQSAIDSVWDNAEDDIYAELLSR